MAAFAIAEGSNAAFDSGKELCRSDRFTRNHSVSDTANNQLALKGDVAIRRRRRLFAKGRFVETLPLTGFGQKHRSGTPRAALRNGLIHDSDKCFCCRVDLVRPVKILNGHSFTGKCRCRKE